MDIETLLTLGVLCGTVGVVIGRSYAVVAILIATMAVNCSVVLLFLTGSISLLGALAAAITAGTTLQIGFIAGLATASVSRGRKGRARLITAR